MANTPEDNHYAKSHEYVHIEGDIGTIGISDYAQKELGDVVFVELPQVGLHVQAGVGFLGNVEGGPGQIDVGLRLTDFGQ